MNKIVAIDGPSGSGKGTIAKILAKKLEYTYLKITYYINNQQLFHQIQWTVFPMSLVSLTDIGYGNLPNR